MTPSHPRVRKRLYTRIMDRYRHSDIYLPGFNSLARQLLRYRAERGFTRVGNQGRANRKQIDDWFGSHRFFFGYAVFRSGTTFLANLLNEAVDSALIRHEANVNDYWYYPKAIQDLENAQRYVEEYRLAEIYFRARDYRFTTYGEINPFLRRHCAAVAQCLPEAQQFQVIRDPTNVIRSLMSRELFSHKDPMAGLVKPHPEDPCFEQWSDMDRFARMCWMWASDNRFIRENTHHVIHFEKMLADWDYFRAMVLEHLGLEMQEVTWQSKVKVINNATPRYTYPGFSEWSTKDRAQFEKICGPEMAEYGY